MKNINFKQKHLFLLILVTSFLFSLSFLWGKIDPDFFSFYYIGKGVVGGKDMYIDFADNKGPVLYVFFSVLYSLFKDNYMLALIISSTFVDAFLSFFSIKIASVWLKSEKMLEGGWGVILTFFITILIKSFSIGSFTGGLYSETLAFLFILSCLLLVERKKYFFAGILYSLAILSRPTSIFWGIVPFVQIFVRQKEKFSAFLRYSAGFAANFIAIILFYIISGGSAGSLIDNLIIFNVGYTHLVRTEHLQQLFLYFILELRVFFSFSLVLVFLYLSLFVKKIKDFRFLMLAVFAASFLSTFVSGLFYFHHFVQFGLIVTLAILFMRKMKFSYLFSPVIILLFLGVLINYYSFIFLKDPELDLRPVQNFLMDHKDIVDSKKYLMVVTYYPQLYFIFDKAAPDRYYQPYFLSERFNIQVDEDAEKHAQLDIDTLDNTLFLIVSKNRFDEWYKYEYVARFGEKFHLTQVAGASDENEEMSLYTANPKQ